MYGEWITELHRKLWKTHKLRMFFEEYGFVDIVQFGKDVT